MEFLTSHILVELQETNNSMRPIVKVAVIKLPLLSAITLREHITVFMPLLIHNLGSPTNILIGCYRAIFGLQEYQ